MQDFSHSKTTFMTTLDILLLWVWAFWQGVGHFASVESLQKLSYVAATLVAMTKLIDWIISQIKKRRSKQNFYKNH